MTLKHLTIVVALGAALATATPADAHAPRLPIGVAEAETLTYESLFADWRIRKANSVPSEIYHEIFLPEEAAYWLRELSLPSCGRVRRNIVDCIAEIKVWDSRSGQGETATWAMRTRRYRDDRVRGGLVTISRLLDGSEWSDVPIRAL